MPARKVLMLAMESVVVAVSSSANVLPKTVKEPWLTLRFTVTGLFPASSSRIWIALAPVKASWLGAPTSVAGTVGATAGTMMTGARFAVVTVMLTADVLVLGSLRV